MSFVGMGPARRLAVMDYRRTSGCSNLVRWLASVKVSLAAISWKKFLLGCSAVAATGC